MKKYLTLIVIALFCISCDGDDSTSNPNVDMTLIDARVEAFGFDLENQDFLGDLRVSCTLKNIGTDQFDSGDLQQIVQLWVGNEMVSYTSFNNVAPGAEVENIISYLVQDVYEYGSEFNPQIRMVISYDPDIGLDDNQYNDDEDLTNNELIVTGAIIDAAIQN